jgi:hypothetical protein
MQNKSFRISPRSQIKHDKAILDLSKLDILLFELAERQKVIQQQVKTAKEKRTRTLKIIQQHK